VRGGGILAQPAPDAPSDALDVGLGRAAQDSPPREAKPFTRASIFSSSAQSRPVCWRNMARSFSARAVLRQRTNCSPPAPSGCAMSRASSPSWTLCQPSFSSSLGFRA